LSVERHGQQLPPLRTAAGDAAAHVAARPAVPGAPGVFISDTVDALDLKEFYARYASGGARNQPFHPAMMVKVLVYGYATGVFSPRKIERWLHQGPGVSDAGAATSPSTARSATSARST
jgi:hypothetical protein